VCFAEIVAVLFCFETPLFLVRFDHALIDHFTIVLGAGAPGLIYRLASASIR
jgi:hypothetical protein